MKVAVLHAASPAHLPALRRAAPRATVESAGTPEEAAALVEDADAILGNRWLLESLPRARRARWVQSNSMGIDRIAAARELLRGATLTCARGVYDDVVAEHATALALAIVRGIPSMADSQRGHRWERRALRPLGSLRALVLGWGGIGRGVARRLAALGARVEGVRRSAADRPAAGADGFVVWGAAWRDALPATDLLVLALPLTAATRGLVGAPELAALASGAFVVNVGRGATLDEGALAEALRAGRLGGAALDVFAEEPLPPASPLWDVPGLLVSPHNARGPEAPPYRWEPFVEENLRRFAAGESLLGVVDLDAGY